LVINSLDRGQTTEAEYAPYTRQITFGHTNQSGPSGEREF